VRSSRGRRRFLALDIGQRADLGSFRYQQRDCDAGVTATYTTLAPAACAKIGGVSPTVPKSIAPRPSAQQGRPELKFHPLHALDAQRLEPFSSALWSLATLRMPPFW